MIIRRLARPIYVKQREKKKGRERNSPVVPNCVFIRRPMIPCKPMLAPISPKHAYAVALAHAGVPRPDATLLSPLFQSAIAAAMVKSAWMNVPRNSHKRVFAPIRSPMRPMKIPKINVVKDVRACLSARRNDVSRWPGGPSKRRASASESYMVPTG